MHPCYFFTDVLKVSPGILVFIFILSNNMLLYVFHVYFETIKLCTGLFSIYLHYYVMLYSHVFITQELWVRPPSLQKRKQLGCYCFFAKNRKVRMSTILISLFKRNMDICVVKTLCGQWPEVPSIDRYLKLFLMTIYYERKNLDVHDVIKKSILTFLVLDYLRYYTL